MEEIEHTRINISKLTDAKHKSKLGQFFTPMTIAKFMASLFPNIESEECILLDAGAGIGSLSDAFLERCVTNELEFKKINIKAYEIDNILRPFLEETLNKYVKKLNFNYEIKSEDFIEAAVSSIQFNSFKEFTHAILNPPYLKINSLSRYRSLLRHVGIETVNLYSAFVALSVLLMRNGGQVVTIIPRSFCNGPYYKTFRKFILSKCAIRHIHLFESRNSAFKDDQVLQENVILYLEVDGIQADVTVSVSTDENFFDYSYVLYPFEAIVKKDDFESFIHIPSSRSKENEQNIFFAQYQLNDIGLYISTGPIV
ncbi:MAG: Eco57I restriction-modification methylase domain-containing protein, partial [Candidatus Delongbacteria bacterium]|nr:Eco57I restriction-modification methylase domain-containing protein [Candidatus Delongbacteria bacterium]